VNAHLDSTLRTLEWVLTAFRGRAFIACSFGGPSSAVILDLAMQLDRTVPVAYIDTGLLFPHTHALIERVSRHYAIEPRAIRPPLSLAEQQAQHGDELWKRDPDRCCELRKVEPLDAFMRSFDAWITGVRRDQNSARNTQETVEWDKQFGVVKVSPVAHWTEAEVWKYVTDNELPYNDLLDRGYPSIGCRPCTRRPEIGDDPRSGRWAGFAKTECGIHGSALRVKSA
jgi:phosphoadenosine phosphosulfate reductase